MLHSISATAMPSPTTITWDLTVPYVVAGVEDDESVFVNSLGILYLSSAQSSFPPLPISCRLPTKSTFCPW